MANIVNASDLKLYLGGVLIAHCTSASLKVNVEMMPATTKDSAGWDEALPGKKSWSIDGSFFYVNAEASNKDFKDILDAITAKTLLSVAFRMSTTGTRQYTGSCYIESADLSAGVEENTTYSTNLRGTGTLTVSNYTTG